MEEKIFFKSSDGLKLRGILSKPKTQTTKCVILCHGITSDKDEEGTFTALSQRLSKDGYAVFRFDFRAHGGSEGSSIHFTITGGVKDIEAAANLMGQKGYNRFGILGASFAGGAVSYYTFAHKNHVKALVLWNPLLDYETRLNPNTDWGKKFWGKPAFERVEKFGYTEIGSKKFKIGKPLLDEMERLVPWKELQKITIPVLFVHGNKDTYTAYEDSVRISKLIRNARLVTIPNGQHCFHSKEDSELAIKATFGFFQNNL